MFERIPEQNAASMLAVLRIAHPWEVIMSHQSSPRRAFLKGALATPVVIAGSSLLASSQARAEGGTHTGPSTSAEPYLRPSIAGAKTVSILTVGDSINGYRMVGIPDGLGAFRSGRNEFTLLMNHELGGTSGVARAHGSTGAFVSRWTINADTLKVGKGQDHTPSPQQVYLWDVATGSYVTGTTQWQRHCSGDLAVETAYYAHGLGTRDRIYLNGEETTDGRAWARIASGRHTGEAWQLPRFGRMAYENAVACPYPQVKTIVACTDDSSAATGPLPNNGSEVYFYVGAKQATGHPIERAGLTNGWLYGLTITVDGQAVIEESDLYGLGTATTGYVGKGRFELVNLGDVSGMTTTLELETQSNVNSVARFQRCEDGAWDPRERHQNDFYYVTTASITTNCRLWRLSFDDIERPELGGTIEILLRGDEGHRMLDNVAIDRLGRIVMDEDPGGNNRIAKIWLYSIDSRELIQVAAHNPRLFDPDSKKPEFITNDEESSGIIDAADILGDGWFLLDVQSHKASSDPELVEGGQLVALWIDPDVGMDGESRSRGNRHDNNDERR
jgi:hypothetical protein